MKKLLSVMFAVVTFGFGCHAITAYELEELCDGRAFEVAQTYMNQNGYAIYSSADLRIKATGANTFTVSGLFGGKWTGQFKISGNYVYPAQMDTYANAIFTPTNGSYVSMTAGNGSTLRVYKLSIFRAILFSQSSSGYQYVTTYNYNNAYGMTYSNVWKGRFDRDENGNLVIIWHANDNMSCQLQYRNSSNSEIGYDIFDGYIIALPETNGTATMRDKTEAVRNFPVQVLHHEQDNTFEIANLYDSGMKFCNFGIGDFEFGAFTGTFYDDGTFEIPQQNSFDIVSGTINQSPYRVSLTHYYTCGYDSESRTPVPSIKGTYTDRNVHHDYTGLNMWTPSDGGTLKTYVDRTLNFDRMGMTDNNGTYTSWPAFHDLVITADMSEIKHGVEFASDYKYGSDPVNGIYFELRPEPFRHTLNVDHYDYYVVPRQVDNIADETAQLCDQDGLKGALKISADEFVKARPSKVDGLSRANTADPFNDYLVSHVPAAKL